MRIAYLTPGQFVAAIFVGCVISYFLVFASAPRVDTAPLVTPAPTPSNSLGPDAVMAQMIDAIMQTTLFMVVMVVIAFVALIFMPRRPNRPDEWS